MLSPMSMVEVRTQIDRMTDEERWFAAAYLQHLLLAEDPEHQRRLSEAMARMDAGRKFTLEQAERIHAALEAEGI